MYKLKDPLVHGQTHLAAQFTNVFLWHFSTGLWREGFFEQKGQKMRHPLKLYN